MKHYVLIAEYPYEGQDLRGVFDTIQAARDHVDARSESDSWMTNGSEALWIYEGAERIADLGRYPYADVLKVPTPEQRLARAIAIRTGVLGEDEAL